MSKINNWYTKNPKEFRRDLWNWIVSGSTGGELGRFFVSVFRRHDRLHNRIIKIFESRTTKGIVVFLVIASIGVALKGEPGKTIFETIFDNLESIALGSAGVIFLLEIKERQKRDQYEAWQVVNSAQDQTGSGGRIQALEDLARDGVNLKGLTVPYAYLSGIDLSYGKLERANLESTQLDNANLKRAILTNANLKGANLQKAHLEGAHLEGACLSKGTQYGNVRDRVNLGDAHLEGAQLVGAQLDEAVLGFAHLNGANLLGACLVNVELMFANMEGANLAHANLSGSNLLQANLKGANLRGANLENSNLYEADLSRAYLRDAKNLTEHQLSGAKLCLTTMPDGTVSKCDCKIVGIDPEKEDLPTVPSDYLDILRRREKTRDDSNR